MASLEKCPRQASIRAMAEIDVHCDEARAGDRWVCDVTVHDADGSSRHEVGIHASQRTALEADAGRDGAERLVRETFRFLLEREPKESILPTFEIDVVGRYFPEYEAEIRRRLADG